MVVKCCGTDVVAAEVQCYGAGLEIFSGGFRWLWCGDGVVGLVRPMVLVAATVRCGLALVSVGVVLGGTGGLEVMRWSSGGD
ncbi:hypothetical protein P8452_06415 [Trifolium repens]|nr:hypothetical protein P8452_06415 [Trifolium repens]